MSMEPGTSGAAGAAGWKLIGGAAGAVGLGAALSALVVMLMTPPRSAREWAVGLVCTVTGSFAGGAYATIKLRLLQAAMAASTDVELVMVVLAMIGIVFACGLPAWAVVRWVFTFIERRNGKDIAEVAREIREIV